MSAISTYLEYIRSKVYAKDVRTAIVNAISQCYDDVNAPALQTEAMQAAVQAKIDAGEMAALIIGDGTITAEKLAEDTVDNTLSLSGIAADSKTVGDQLKNINAFIQMSGIPTEVEDYSFVQGTINTTTGADGGAVANRCRTPSFIMINDDRLQVTPKEGYKISGRLYETKSVSSFISATDWTTNAIIYTKSPAYCKIVIAKVDDSNINASGLPDDVISVVSYSKTDRTLSNNGIPADAETVGNAVSCHDILINNQENMINYDYDIPYIRKSDPNGSDILKLGIERYKNLIMLNGAVLGSGIYVRLNGNVVSSQSTVTVESWEGIKLQTNHKYRVEGRLISGEISATFGYLPSVSVYKTGRHNTEGTILERDEKHFIREFIAEDTNYNFVLWIPGGITYKNAVHLITIKDLSENKNIIERNDPIKTVALLQQLTGKSRIGWQNFGKKPLCLVHFSDIHGDAECLKNIILFKNEYEEYIDDVIHTGDSVYYSYTDGMDFWNGVTGSEKILNVIGNHDTNVRTPKNQNDWTGLDMSDTYNTYFSPYIENWEATYTDGCTYYYKDYNTEGVRLIVLDIMHQTSDQLEWFTSVLASARTNELDVIVAVHAKSYWRMSPYDCAWDDIIHVPDYYKREDVDTSSYSGASYPSNLASGYIDAVDNFIEDGGLFIAWIHGHTHYRMLAKLTDHPNQLDFSVANAGRPGYAWTFVWNRFVDSDSKNMDDFNVIAIDTTGKILRAIKIGVDTDRYMRTAHSIGYNYATHTIITAE